MGNDPFGSIVLVLGTIGVLVLILWNMGRHKAPRKPKLPPNIPENAAKRKRIRKRWLRKFWAWRFHDKL